MVKSPVPACGNVRAHVQVSGPDPIDLTDPTDPTDPIDLIDLTDLT
jgi:hypothetical protein